MSLSKRYFEGTLSPSEMAMFQAGQKSLVGASERFAEITKGRDMAAEDAAHYAALKREVEMQEEHSRNCYRSACPICNPNPEAGEFD